MTGNDRPSEVGRFKDDNLKKDNLFPLIQINQYICSIFNKVIEMKDINRLKIVLVEKKKTGKWLAKELGKDPSTVSKWCTNVSQPDLVTLSRIAELLNVDRRDLINKSK